MERRCYMSRKKDIVPKSFNIYSFQQAKELDAKDIGNKDKVVSGFQGKVGVRSKSTRKCFEEKCRRLRSSRHLRIF